MLTLQKEKATIHTFGNRTYYVFPAPATHTNVVNRPKKYVEEGATTFYRGRGSNGSAKLLPEVHSAVNNLMTALLEYGDNLGDFSIQSAVVQNGWRQPDDPSQGVHYLDNIKMVINTPEFASLKLTFPKELEGEAEGFLGEKDNPHWLGFVNDLSRAWGEATAKNVLDRVAHYYVPRGRFNPHATGLVFDLNFSIYHHVYKKSQKALVESEDPVNASPLLNEAALRSALGMWLNTYAMVHFNFDSYDTASEIWHMEWRRPKSA